MLYNSYSPSQQVEMVFTNLQNRYPGLKDSSEATKHDANESPTQQTDTRRVGSGCSLPHDVILEAALTAIPVHSNRSHCHREVLSAFLPRAFVPELLRRCSVFTIFRAVLEISIEPQLNKTSALCNCSLVHWNGTKGEIELRLST